MTSFPPRLILVAVDLAAPGWTAWRHAAALAARCGADVEAIHVDPYRAGGEGLYPGLGLTPDRARDIRARVRKATGAGVVHVVEGDPAGRILAAARARRAGLIVVGSRGRRGLERALLGSVAESVLSRSAVPVIVARGAVRPTRTVLAPVNFTPHADAAAAYAAELASRLGAGLTLLHVARTPAEAAAAGPRLLGRLAALPPRARASAGVRVIRARRACDGVLRALRGGDLVVLSAHRGSLRQAVFGATARQVLRRTGKPLLAVPAPRRVIRPLPAVHGRRGNE